MKNVLAKVLMAPLVLLVLAAFIVSIYAAAQNLYSITWGTPILFALILVLFVIGLKMKKKQMMHHR